MNNDMFEQAEQTIYCYNNISYFCHPEHIDKSKSVIINYTYLYISLVFMLLPILVFICACISIKVYSEINIHKKIKKREKYGFLGHNVSIQ
jgi:hypothetical protein